MEHQEDLEHAEEVKQASKGQQRKAELSGNPGDLEQAKRMQSKADSLLDESKE